MCYVRYPHLSRYLWYLLHYYLQSFTHYYEWNQPIEVWWNQLFVLICSFLVKHHLQMDYYTLATHNFSSGSLDHIILPNNYLEEPAYGVDSIRHCSGNFGTSITGSIVKVWNIDPNQLNVDKQRFCLFKELE